MFDPGLFLSSEREKTTKMGTLTASTHLVIPSLIGHGLTDDVARDTLAEAQRVGWATALVHGTGVLSVTYAGENKFTVGRPAHN